MPVQRAEEDVGAVAAHEIARGAGIGLQPCIETVGGRLLAGQMPGLDREPAHRCIGMAVAAGEGDAQNIAAGETQPCRTLHMHHEGVDGIAQIGDSARRIAQRAILDRGAIRIERERAVRPAARAAETLQTRRRGGLGRQSHEIVGPGEQRRRIIGMGHPARGQFRLEITGQEAGFCLFRIKPDRPEMPLEEGARLGGRRPGRKSEGGGADRRKAGRSRLCRTCRSGIRRGAAAPEGAEGGGVVVGGPSFEIGKGEGNGLQTGNGGSRHRTGGAHRRKQEPSGRQNGQPVRKALHRGAIPTRPPPRRVTRPPRSRRAANWDRACRACGRRSRCR